MIKTYRKKPFVIHAIQYDGYNKSEVEEFVGEDLRVDGDLSIYIPTLEGEIKASVGDFVINGVVGEFYPCKEDVFYKTYEEV